MCTNQKQIASVSASDATSGSYEPSSGRARVGNDDARGRGRARRQRGIAEAGPTSANGSSTSAWKRSPGLTARQVTALVA